IRRQAAALAPLLLSVLDRPPPADWPDAPSKPISAEPAPDTVKRIEHAEGFVTSTWSICQALPVVEFETIAADLGRAGYRPNCLRPYQADDGVLMAVVWLSD